MYPLLWHHASTQHIKQLTSPSKPFRYFISATCLDHRRENRPYYICTKFTCNMNVMYCFQKQDGYHHWLRQYTWLKKQCSSFFYFSNVQLQGIEINAMLYEQVSNKLSSWLPLSESASRIRRLCIKTKNCWGLYMWKQQSFGHLVIHQLVPIGKTLFT